MLKKKNNKDASANIINEIDNLDFKQLTLLKYCLINCHTYHLIKLSKTVR